jgi:hypothetical protein
MTRGYAWQRLYQRAIVETDPSRLPLLIGAARAVITMRSEQLRNDSPESREERQSLDDALASLRVLKQESANQGK